MQTFEFDTRHRNSADSLTWGFLRFDKLRSIRARVNCYRESEAVAGIGIFGFDTKGRDDDSVISIRMYRLPAGEEQFLDGQEAFGTKHEAWPLPGGRRFEPTMLAPSGIPADWEHYGIQTVRSGRDIVHAWRDAGHGLIIRYALPDRDPLAHPPSVWLAQNLRVNLDAWEFGSAPPNADDERASQRTTDKPLSDQELEQLAANAMRAFDHLRLPMPSSSTMILDAIHAEVERSRPTFARQKPNVQHNLSVCLGTLWGQALVNETDWEWCELIRGDEDEGFLAIISPDRTHAISPVDFLVHLLTQPEDAADNTVRLLFNMIKAGKLPPSRPGKYLMLS